MKRTTLFSIFFLSIGLIFTFADTNNPAWGTGVNPTWVADELVLVFDSSIKAAAKDEIRAKYGLTQIRESKKPGKFVLYRHAHPETVLAGLKNESGIVSAERNAYAYTLFVPNDPFYWLQWNMTRIGLEDAWDISTGSPASVVAHLDTGVSQSLEDFNTTLFLPGWDFVNNDDDPDDDNGHGSHVCGTIAQSTDNHIGVAGVAFNAAIMPIKVFNAYGAGTYADIADGIFFAVDNGAHVINMSFGGAVSSPIVEAAVNYAWDSGLLMSCAPGYSGTSQPTYPAAYENCMAVSATTSIDTLAPYSNYGDTIDISAPGGDYEDHNGDGYPDAILQCSGTGYSFMAGTSWSAAHVSGVAALVKAANPRLTNVHIRRILERTAEDLGDPGWDPYFGWGLVDAYTAVRVAISMFIHDIHMETRLCEAGVYALAYVTIHGSDDLPVKDALVYGTWSGDVHGEVKAETDANGVAVLKSPVIPLSVSHELQPKKFVIKVKDVTHALFQYNPAMNKVKPTAWISY